MDDSERLLDSKKGLVRSWRYSGDVSYDSENDSVSYTESVDSTSFIQPQHAGAKATHVPTYGATALSASGKSSNVILTEFDPFPVDVVCFNCHQHVVTQTSSKAGRTTYLTSVAIGLCTCGLGCFLIPFCVSVLKDVHHTCPKCGTVVGVYHRKLRGR